MADELQHLLDRIQTDGVEKAEAESKTIIEEAKAKAAKILEDAGAAAKATRAQAEKDAEAFIRRAEQSLQQAARDTVLSVKSAVDSALEALVAKAADKEVTGDLLKSLIETAVKAYAEEGKPLDVIVPEARQEEFAAWAAAAFADAAGDGVDIKGDRTLAYGFRVSMADGRIQHDFSSEAITEALAKLLRPKLAEILKNAQKES